jgi:hypothetical protein
MFWQVAKNVGHCSFFWNYLCTSSPLLLHHANFGGKNKGKKMHQGILKKIMALK